MPEPIARLQVDPAAAWRGWWESIGVRYPLSGDVTQSIDTAFFRATERVASYGRRLGLALDDLLALRADLEAVKPRPGADRVDRLVSEVRALRTDEEGNAEALRRLREALR